MFTRILSAACRCVAWLLQGRSGEPERCVACTLPIERGAPAFPYARGGRVHEECAYGRFARSRSSYGTLDSRRPFCVHKED